MPIAHAEGNYFADEETVRRLEDGGQVVFRYCDAAGELSDAANPNGSLHAIAGIRNEAGNVLGMMPHPERASEQELGCEDGRFILESLLASLAERS
jgi:phosphoribosylformylglycinamidine synthase